LARKRDVPASVFVVPVSSIGLPVSGSNGLKHENRINGRTFSGPWCQTLPRYAKAPSYPRVCYVVAGALSPLLSNVFLHYVRQKAQSFAFHAAIASTADPTSFEFKVNPYITVRQISNATHPAIVDRAPSTTSLAGRFFERRTSVTTRAMRSPKTPRSASQGRKPSNRYASERRLSLREVAIAKSCPISRGHQDAQTLAQIGSPTFSS
jgi:hypothetical protein